MHHQLLFGQVMHCYQYPFLKQQYDRYPPAVQRAALEWHHNKRYADVILQPPEPVGGGWDGGMSTWEGGMEY